MKCKKRQNISFMVMMLVLSMLPINGTISSILSITSRSTSTVVSANGKDNWTEIDSFVYLLQNISIDELARTSVDLAIIDYSLDGTESGELTKEQVEAIKTSGFNKKVLSYLSIGEAEDYRYYWNDSWLTNPPEWLDEENPEWEGNYKVKYWYPEWQTIIFDYLDKIIDAGFDGVYLDIIDAYEYYQDKVPDSDIKMMDFVIKIANHARNRTNNPDWGIFPQNAEELARNSTYLQVISGIGREDVFLREDDSDTIRPKSELEPIIEDLRHIKNAGKLVLTIDYTRNVDLIKYVYQQARSHGFVAYVTDRSLDRITIEYTTILATNSEMNDKDLTSYLQDASFLTFAVITFLLLTSTVIISNKRKKKK